LKRKITQIAIGIFVTVFLAGVISGSFRNGLRRLVSSFSSGITSIPSSVSDKYSEVKNNFTDAEYLHKEMKKLQLQLQTQKLQYYDTEVLRRENEQLKALLKLQSDMKQDVISARIIMREPLSWFRNFTINRGSKHNVEIGQPVLYDGNLIGRVKEVFSDRSIVITIADPDCQVSCRIKGTSYYGVMKGKGGGSLFKAPDCQLEYVFRDAELKMGMIVETSGFGERIPAGLPIGSLIKDDEHSEIGRAVNNIYKSTKVYPFADFSDPVFVTVITSKE